MFQFIALYKVLFLLVPLMRYNSMSNQLTSFTPSASLQQNMKDAFLLIDKNNDYQITVKDLDAILADLEEDFTKQEIQQMLYEFNQKRKGMYFFFVDIIKHMAITYKDRPSELETRDAFHILDKDNDGFITLKEIRHVMTRLSGRVGYDYIINGFIHTMDLNEDGKINFEEFSRKYSTVFKKLSHSNYL